MTRQLTFAGSILGFIGIVVACSGTKGGPSGGAGGSGGGFSTGGFAGVGGSATGGSGGTGGKASGGTGGSGAAGTGGTGGGTSSPIGKACTSNADCQGGLVCVTTLTGETVPGGVCSVTCGSTQGDPDLECRSFDASAICLGFGPAGSEAWCVQTCTVGVATSCQNRQDMACAGLVDAAQNPAGNACIPLCTNDAQCTTGTCNGETNLCSTTADPGTLPLGSRCNPAATTDECQDGLCVEIDNAGNAFCTMACRLGTLPQCGWSGPPSTDFPGVCALVSDQNANAADLGFCAQTCNTTADCTARHPNFTCNIDATLSQFGKAGICFSFTTTANN